MEKSSCPSSAQLGLGIALSFGLIISTWIFTHSTANERHTITVKGYAEKAVIAEQGCWSGTISVRHDNLVDSYKELGEQVNGLCNFIVDAGFEEGAIERASQYHQTINKKTSDGNITNEIEYYTASQTVVVRSTDVQAIRKLSEKTPALNEKGYNLTSNEPAYYYPSDKLELIKLQMIAEATNNAHQRATQFANNSGSKVNKLVQAKQGLFQVVAPYSATSDYDRYDTSSIEKVVKLVVTLTYNVA